MAMETEIRDTYHRRYVFDQQPQRYQGSSKNGNGQHSQCMKRKVRDSF